MSYNLDVLPQSSDLFLLLLNLKKILIRIFRIYLLIYNLKEKKNPFLNCYNINFNSISKIHFKNIYI